jgi:site-specific DNA-methyltransferase (adenine-specific)
MTDYLQPSSCWLLWDKGFSPDVSFAQFEMAWTSFNTSTKKYDFNAAANRNRIHPTQKPVKLYEWLLQNYAKPNNKILDTHLGSGSIAIACNRLKYELTACELDSEYFEASVKRYKEQTAQIQIF